MPAIPYTVRTTCPSIQVRGRYLAWLSPNHIAEVMKASIMVLRWAVMRFCEMKRRPVISRAAQVPLSVALRAG